MAEWWEPYMQTSVAGGLNYLVQQGMGRDKYHKQALRIEKFGRDLESQLSSFDKDYAEEMSGQLTAKELENRNYLLNKTKLDVDQATARKVANIQQQYSRAGIGGQELANAIAEVQGMASKDVTNYAKELDSYLMEKAMNRASQVKQVRTQLANQINSTIGQMEYENTPFDTTQALVKAFAPGLVAGAVAPLAGQDFAQGMAKGTVGSALESVGLSPDMFKPRDAELPKEVGGITYEPETAKTSLGDTYVKSWLPTSEKSQTLKAFAENDEDTLKAITYIGTPNPDNPKQTPQQRYNELLKIPSYKKLSKKQQAAIDAFYNSRTMTAQQKTMNWIDTLGY